MIILNQTITKMKKNILYRYCFIINIKTEVVYKEIANDVEKRFDTSNYEINRPLPIGKTK